MDTFVLSPQNANLPVHDLIARAMNGSIEVLDVEGNVVAYVLSPVDREVLTYAEAKLDMDQHHEAVSAAMHRCGGVTTRQLIENAKAAAQTKSSQT